jgi:DNA-binding MarR family transcriptional regulator
MEHQPSWVDDKERAILTGYRRAMRALRDIYTEMSAQQMMLLFEVAHEGVISQRELGDRLDMPASTAARNIATLSPLGVAGRTGLGLVDWEPHPTDRRQKSVVLTPRGKTLMTRILNF